MPVDPSISLGVKTPDPTSYISSFIDLGQKKLNLDKSRQTFDADVSQRLAESARANTEAGVAAQTAAPRIELAQSQAGQAWANMSSAQLENARAHAASMIQQLQPLSTKPDLTTKDVSDSVIDSMRAQNAPPQAIALALQNMPPPDAPPPVVQGFVKQALIRAQGVTAHLATITPSPTGVATSAGTQFVNTNPNAPPPVASPMGAPLPPPNQVVTDTTGAPTIVNPAGATAAPIRSTGGPQMAFPPGETSQTQQSLQTERDAAKGAALTAPQMHDINRSIVAEVDKGLTTGKLGEISQKLSSITGFNLGTEGSTDYNVLGKMLERSALTAAQGMGPHTNAGLEAQVRANGSTEYTPQAIRKIANLNDALTTGASMYQAGVENSIQQTGSVFGKRQFDQQWSQAMNPSGGVNGVQALRFKNAIDNGDTKERDAVLAELGGARSPKAAALLAKLQALQKLSGQ